MGSIVLVVAADARSNIPAQISDPFIKAARRSMSFTLSESLKGGNVCTTMSCASIPISRCAKHRVSFLSMG